MSNETTIVFETDEVEVPKNIQQFMEQYWYNQSHRKLQDILVEIKLDLLSTLINVFNRECEVFVTEDTMTHEIRIHATMKFGKTSAYTMQKLLPVYLFLQNDPTVASRIRHETTNEFIRCFQDALQREIPGLTQNDS